MSVCGCCHAPAFSGAALAARRGHGRPPAPAAHARHAGEARAVGAARQADAAPGVRGYSPPPPPVSPIRGLIDFHTHAAPDVFGRAVDDEELAAMAAARQMEAVVFKSHVTLTADRAWLARKHVAGIKVFGGITLNAAVGGLNPAAVEWMWRMQGGHGRVVWLPTFDADHHVRRAGTAPAGIRVVDERGAVLPAARDVFKVCAAQRLVVHTGHASADQALALIAAAREEGCERVVVTHAQLDVVGMTEAQMKQAASMGAKLELCALAALVGPEAPLEWMRHSARVPLAETAACIRAVGAQHFVLGTDLGQTGNPTPADGLQMFVAGLAAEGISREQIQTMGREVPGALLMG
ncbi:MAG: histidinol phosphatase [Candidatus Rokubacteria bacterium]|nr:histidinol phosphatase [Candidatus Rokubacteria bacterium]